MKQCKRAATKGKDLQISSPLTFRLSELKRRQCLSNDLLLRRAGIDKVFYRYLRIQKQRVVVLPSLTQTQMTALQDGFEVVVFLSYCSMVPHQLRHMPASMLDTVAMGVLRDFDWIIDVAMLYRKSESLPTCDISIVIVVPNANVRIHRKSHSWVRLLSRDA
jgi:hypothetical protein